MEWREVQEVLVQQQRNQPPQVQGLKMWGWVMQSPPAFLPCSAILIGKLQSAGKGWWNCAQWMRKGRQDWVLATKHANPHRTRKTLISFMELPSTVPSFPGRIMSRGCLGRYLPVSRICDIRKISRERRWQPGDLSVLVDLHLLICSSKEVENSQTFRSLESVCTTSGTFCCTFSAVFNWVLCAGILFLPRKRSVLLPRVA